MKFTPEQRQAIDASAREVFVTAGAGSGKTSLLVGRYLRAVFEDGCRPESLPTVTFTNRAAAELRDRIRQGLVAGGRSDLAQRLDGAPIGTIHGLCARLLRTSPVEAGVDPGFAVLDQDQTEILLADAWAEVWLERISTAPEEELDALGAGEAALTRGIVPLYSALRGLGETEPRFVVPAPGARSSMTERTAAALEALRLEARACRDVPTTIANREKLDACLEWLQGTPESDQTPADLTCYFPHRGCGADAKPLFVEVIELLERHRAALAEARLARLAAIADELLQQLHVAYARRKRERGVLDFADLELLALGLVRGGARPFGPEGRLMVDEFQDTNGLQCALLDGLGVGTVLTVGDAYQSIYGFRGADVDVFRRRDRALESRPPDDVLRTSLLTNFRSRPPVLAVLNHLFSRDGFFGAAFPLLRAGRDDGPRRGRETSSRGALAPAVEMCVLDLADADVAEAGAERRAELEAAHVAEHVEGLVRDGWRPRDVVVLLRVTTHFGAFERALGARGLPTYVVGGRGYFAQDEIADVLALLQLLVNPYDDAALVTVLRSPIVGVSDDALALLRMSAETPVPRGGVRGASTGRFLWQALARPIQADFDATVADSLSESDRRSLASVVRRVELLRRRYGRTGLAALLEEALMAFDYDLAILQGKDGRRRFANIMKLLRLAEQYESVDGPDLAGLLAYLKRKSDVGEREGNAAVLAEDENVVRVMTIHQAKGLEFPVVVVAGLGAERRRRGGPTFLVDTQGRRAVRVRQTKAEGNKGHFSLGPAAVMVEERERREDEEEDRLYYVAGTRAEERLVLVGTRASSRREESGGCTDVLSRMLAAVGCGAPAVGEHLRPVDGLDLVVTGLSAVIAIPEALPSPREPMAAPPAPAPVSPRGAATTAGRVSFSALHAYHECPRRYYVERVLGVRVAGAVAADGPDVLDGPDGPDDHVDPLESGGRGPDGRALGIAVHRVLQSLPLDRVPAAEHVDALVERARNESYEGSPAVSPASCRELVLGFWRSPLAALPGLAVAEQEQAFTFAHGGVLVTGVMDVVVRSADHWHVIDYKTNRLGRSAPVDLAQQYLLQQQVYALACLLAGAPHVTVSLLFLERPEDPVAATFAPDDLPLLRDALATGLDGLARGDFTEKEGPWCTVCESQSLCRVLARSSAMV